MPVDDSAAVGAVVVLDMAMKWKLQAAATVQKPSLFEVTSFSTYIAPVLNMMLWTD